MARFRLKNKTVEINKRAIIALKKKLAIIVKEKKKKNPKWGAPEINLKSAKLDCNLCAFCLECLITPGVPDAEFAGLAGFINLW